MTDSNGGQTAKRVVLLNDTSAWYHWGCTCTSTAIKDQITARGFSLDAVPITAVYRCSETPDRIADFRDPAFFERFRAANRDVIDPLAASDVVVVNGEGTLHGTKPAVRRLLYLAFAAKTHLGRQVHIVNHSCFPENIADLSPGPAAALYKTVYNAMDYVAVREPLSAQVLNALEVPATLAFDSLPLYVDAHQPSRSNSSRGGVVLAGSVAWRAEAITVLARLIEHFRRQGQAVSFLIGAQANPASDDRALVAALKDVAPGGWALVEAGTARAWLDVIAGASVLISGRFHHTIAALSLATPCVVMTSNTPKMEGMLRMMDQPPPIPFEERDLLTRLIGKTEEVLSDRSPSSDGALRDRMCRLAQKNFLGLDAVASPAGANALPSTGVRAAP